MAKELRVQAVGRLQNCCSGCSAYGLFVAIPVATVGSELGVNEATLDRWATAFKARNEMGQSEVTESDRETHISQPKPTMGSAVSELGGMRSPLI